MFHQLALVGLVRGREEAGDKEREKGGWSVWEGGGEGMEQCGERDRWVSI